jgi:nucleoside-diphosphate-sugar epimerase
MTKPHDNCDRTLTRLVCTESLARIFDRPNGKQWDYVFNCGGETRFSQDDELYKLRIVALATALGTEAAKRGVKTFVELSSGHVYKPDREPRKETDKLKPVFKLAQYELQAEEELQKIEGFVLLCSVISTL